MAADDSAALLGEFAEFMRARQEAAAEDSDPDNDRDVTFAAGDKSVTIPWRKARDFDLDALLESTFGVKRKAAPAAGGDSDGGSGTGKTAAGGKAPAAGQGSGASQVANLFRAKPAKSA